MLDVFAVLDRKLREFGPLMVERNEDSMVRSVLTAIRGNADHMMAKYPEDFDLYRLGRYNPETGELCELGVVLVSTVSGILQKYNGPPSEGV